MSSRAIRGRLLSFRQRPEGRDDIGAYSYVEDGLILVGADGRITFSGAYDASRIPKESTVDDQRPNLISAGFIDPHIHFVQMQVVGSYAANLLEWLNTYTFIEEQRFSDPVHGSRIASAFFDELIRQGTTTASAFCSVHPESVDAYFAEAMKRNMAMAGGKVMMDRECPEELRDSAERGYEESTDLIAKWHGTGRNSYVISPRFAITSSPAQLAVTRVLRDEHPDLLLQTHVNENRDEIKKAGELYPDYPTYLGIYADYGLLGPKSLMGHSIHYKPHELDMMRESGAVAVSCPTSNLFLGSGLYDLAQADRNGIRTAVATDIGGGTSYSMLKTLDEFYKVQQLKGGRLDPVSSFWFMTAGNAEALGMQADIGRIEVGKFADLVVLDARAIPSMAIKMERVERLEEELFLLQTLGDDRCIAETYVAGVPMKSAISR